MGDHRTGAVSIWANGANDDLSNTVDVETCSFHDECHGLSCSPEVSGKDRECHHSSLTTGSLELGHTFVNDPVGRNGYTSRLKVSTEPQNPYVRLSRASSASVD